MTDEPVINVRGLTKRFGNNTVVDGLDLTVGRGAIYGFLGPNGSGKTTTIRMVCGLLTPDAGEGTCLGFDLRTEARKIKERVGYMTQRFTLYQDLTIRENLEFIARMYQLKNIPTQVNDSLEDLGLSARQNQLASALSGGWKQRLALAACMIHSPDLLLLDEPTAGVDPKARRDFWDEIRAYSARGVTTLVSTHYMDEAVQCDRIAFISHGRKMIDAPTPEIPARTGLIAYRLSGDGALALVEELKADPRIELVARFGNTVHVCGIDKAALRQALEPHTHKPNIVIEEINAGLEEAFIHLMTEKDEVA